MSATSRSVVEIGHDVVRSVDMDDNNQPIDLVGSDEEKDDDESSIEALQWDDFDEEEMELARQMAAKVFSEPQSQNAEAITAGLISASEGHEDAMLNSESSNTSSEDDKVSVVNGSILEAEVQDEVQDVEDIDFPADIKEDDEENFRSDDEMKKKGDELLKDDDGSSTSYLTADNLSACGSSLLADDKASQAPVLDDGPIWSPGPKMYKFHENRTFNQKLTIGVILSVVLAVGIGVGNLVAYNEYESEVFKPVEQLQCPGPIRDPRISSEQAASIFHNGFSASENLKAGINVADDDSDAQVPKKILESYNRQTETLAYVVQSIDKLSKKFDQFENTTKQLSGLVIVNEENRKHSSERSAKLTKLTPDESIFARVPSVPAGPSAAVIIEDSEKTVEGNLMEEVTVTTEPFNAYEDTLIYDSPNAADYSDKAASSMPFPEASAKFSTGNNAESVGNLEFPIHDETKPDKRPVGNIREVGTAAPVSQHLSASTLTKEKEDNSRNHKDPKRTPVNTSVPRRKVDKVSSPSGTGQLPIKRKAPERMHVGKHGTMPPKSSKQNSSVRREEVQKPYREYKGKQKSPDREYKPKKKEDFAAKALHPERARRQPSPEKLAKKFSGKDENFASPNVLGSEDKPHIQKPSKKKSKRDDVESPHKNKKNGQHVYEKRKSKKHTKENRSEERNKREEYLLSEEFDWHSYRAKTRENRRLHQYWKNEFEQQNWQLDRDRAREKFRNSDGRLQDEYHKRFYSTVKIR